MIASNSPPETGPQPVEDALEASLLDIWHAVFGRRDLGPRDNLFEHGVDSLRAAQMLLEVRRRLGATLPISVLIKAPTVETLAAEIRRGPNPALWRSVVPIRAAGSRPPLFLVHPARGSVLGYLPLADGLDPEQPVYALQPQGADGRTHMALRIPDIAAIFVEGLRQVCPTGPYAVAGFSFGGLVAWEIAQQLRRLGASVPLLALLDTQRPSLSGFVRRHWEALARRSPLEAAEYLATKALGRARQEWTGLQLTLFGRGRREEPPPLAEIHLRSSHAARRYRPTSYRGRVLLIQTSAERERDWRRLVSGRLDVHTVGGRHTDLLKPPQLGLVTRWMGAALAESGPSTGVAHSCTIVGER